MGISSRLSDLRDRAAKALPKVTPWLWPIALPAAFLSYSAEHADEFRRHLEWTESLPGFLTNYGFLQWAAGCFVFSFLFALTTRAGWRVAALFSLMTWVCAVGVFSSWSGSWGWMPSYLDLFPDFVSYLRSDFSRYDGILVSVLDLNLLITVLLAAAVLALHVPKVATEGLHAIGGRWHLAWAVLLAMFVEGLLSGNNPLTYVDLLYSSAYGDWRYDWAAEPTVWDTVVEQARVVVPLLAAFFVLAWKTRATLTFRVDRMVVGLGGAVDLFRVRWKTVLQVNELAVRGERRSAIVEHGLLPWYRLRFGLHARRDGARVLDMVCRFAPRTTRTELRRATVPVGYAMLLVAAACFLVMKLTMDREMALFSESSESLLRSFAGAGHFLLFGLMMIGISVGLGLGIGLLFASNYGGVRALPLMGVALAAFLLPGPLIYWLVYIAIYAILAARLAPVESVPDVGFPDATFAVFGMWVADAMIALAVGGYLLGTLIALKPWYRAVPWWPYCHALRRRRAQRPVPG